MQVELGVADPREVIAAYVRLPAHPGKGAANCVAETVSLTSVIEEYLGPDNYGDTGAVSCTALLEIYARRQGTAGTKFSGFDELLESLESQGADKAIVHTFAANQRTIVAFTDVPVTFLIGLLVEVEAE